MSHRLHTLQSDALRKNEDIGLCHRECNERATYKEKGREVFSSYFQAARGAETGSDMPQYKLECVCVCSFLAFYKSVFALWGGKSKRGGKTVSVLVETDCCVCVFEDNAITPSHTPLSELKSPRHMHAPLLSLSQTILCSGHTFAIVLLTTKQTAANISSLYLSLSCAGLSSLPESSVAAALCGAELFLCCCFVHFWP